MRQLLIYALFGSVSFLFTQCDSNPDTLVSHQAIPDKIDYNFHVKPILSDRCYACHGPDEKVRKANLRLDMKSSAFSNLDSEEERYAIIPGDIENSQLVQHITSKDPDMVMPPPESKLSLSESEIAILIKWIEQGAEWKPHWAFVPIQKPELPSVHNDRWGANEIDRFILRKLKQEGLQPSEEAAREKLIRRLSFDLRGLPPSLAEIDAFIHDNSPDGYEKLVDKFLSDQAYGERLALEWMDLARYADSHGYQDDIERSMWPWRDWVIKAFNANMPYDQFVTWQLAGDLLPESTYEQKLATGFNRNHKITQEVGVIDEEYRVTYVFDRVNTFSTSFLGLTMECAQCHDHKYDPFSQEDYYRLFAFFNQVPEKGRVDYGVEVANPSIALPDEKVQEIRTFVNHLLEYQKDTITNYADKVWKENEFPNQITTDNRKQSIALPKGLASWYPLDYQEDSLIRDVLQGQVGSTHHDLISIAGKYSGGMEFMGDNYAHLSPSNRFRFDRPFTICFWLKSLDGGIRGPVLGSVTNQNQAVFNISVNSIKELSLYLGNFRNKTSVQLSTKKTIPENKWTLITITHDGTGQKSGFKIFMDNELIDVYVQKDNLRGKVPQPHRLYLGKSTHSKGILAAQIDELMLFRRSLGRDEIAKLQSFNPINSILSNNEKTESDRKRLLFHYLHHQDLNFRKLNDRIREYKIKKVRTEEIVLKPTMVMADMDSTRTTYTLNRGLYSAKGEIVTPETPAVILEMDEESTKNRLGLAQWLFDPRNPLTARVTVNRYWQMIFGKGIVDTPEDFGSQGSLPTHPELLDWLASHFIESGWDVQHLLKTMVLSTTYRQSVTSKAKLQESDPDNRLLARGVSVRLPAELIRDHALKISGLLNPQLGGPSVKPYQPKGLWLEVASGNQSLRKYIQDHGGELYRRSLYIFWKRTIPPPSMTIFDAPSREQCVVKRINTSTPLQALVLLNDPQFVEASRLLATRMIREGGENVDDRITLAFRLATSRPPAGKELRVLKQLIDEQLDYFESHPEAAAHLIQLGEHDDHGDIPLKDLAAYTVVANSIINLTESIMKG